MKSTLLRRAARLALQAAKSDGELTILLANDDRLKALNEKFRGKSAPTNVLSFESSSRGDGYLGDIAIAFGVTSREAAAAEKPLSHHAAHLVVHGVLHLLGYDHEIEADARVMEALEVDVLAKMGIGDPYATHAAAE
jgi:probable rRNA maturation factor